MEAPRGRFRETFDRGLNRLRELFFLAIGMVIVGVPIVIVAYPFWDAYYEREITGSDWDQIKGSGIIRTAGWTTYDILFGTPKFGIDFKPRHYFNVNFNNQSDYIIKSARINLTITNGETNEQIYSASSPCLREGDLVIRPGENGSPDCGFPLPTNVSDFIEMGAKVDVKWTCALYGTRRPLRIVAWVGSKFEDARVGAEDWMRWFESLFERV